MPRKSYSPGETIFQQGDESEEAYWIVSGSVEISIETPQGRSVLTTLEAGEIFGEMGIIDDQPRAATARALTTTEVDVFHEADFATEILRNERRLLPYIETLFERLRTSAALLRAEIAHHAPSTALVPHAETRLAYAGGQVAATPSTLTLVATAQSESFLPSGSVSITKFPFRVGRRSDGDHGGFIARLDLAISDERPYSVSRGHCIIERKGDAFFVRDCGSRLGTIVNGALLGAGSPDLVARLQPGENELILGPSEANQHYRLILD
jgi:CRP-like cAMP-binding protein